MRGNGRNANATSGGALEHDALCEELAACQAKCFGLEQDVAI